MRPGPCRQDARPLFSACLLPAIGAYRAGSREKKLAECPSESSCFPGHRISSPDPAAAGTLVRHRLRTCLCAREVCVRVVRTVQ
ncbi:hypothetical protein GQ53DRAFT_744252 [Thozetella sp. PMI_491]|nr:hypothetical protein GQ53DRAFT_744252 [Thozetella sp. PMI_491]